MNERMFLLYKQAQVPYTAVDPSNNMPYETTCFSADKFAELIVRECVNKQMALARNYETSIVGYEPVAPEFLEGTINGLKEGCELVLEYFGITE